MESSKANWISCDDCKGRGRRVRRLGKKARLNYQLALDEFEKNKKSTPFLIRPQRQYDTCSTCRGSGLIESEEALTPDQTNLPHVAIIGGGIGGVALAVACLHRGIPFTLYERDTSFDERSQGYGLTLQQASQAMKGFGINHLENGIVSTKHVIHTIEGEIIGEWGMRKWNENNSSSSPKRTNIHISRQCLRQALLAQLKDNQYIRWGHQLMSYKTTSEGGVELEFSSSNGKQKAKADLIVGADGIRSAVRQSLISEESSPLKYLDCIVILGICPLSSLNDIESSLLDSKTVFQTANGNERIYVMPFDSKSVMWQLSYPLEETKAKALNKKGPSALKAEAIKLCQWHSPIPEILSATPPDLISGYPVYDRRLLTPEEFQNAGPVTLIGDAAHPMSPFKGQGANQALLDALSLARSISLNCRPLSNWRTKGIRQLVLNDYELEMLERSAQKVKDSAAAAQFLHSETVLKKGNKPRGSF